MAWRVSPQLARRAARVRWTGQCSTSPGATPWRGRPAGAVRAKNRGGAAKEKPLPAYTGLKDDGSTACGCWIYCGVYADGVNQAARRRPGVEQDWVAAEWGWAWPANRRILYNRASADRDGHPWSERKALIWWDGERHR